MIQNPMTDVIIILFVPEEKNYLKYYSKHLQCFWALIFFFYQNLQDSLFLAQLQLPGFKIFPNSAEETAPS